MVQDRLSKIYKQLTCSVISLLEVKIDIKINAKVIFFHGLQTENSIGIRLKFLSFFFLLIKS